MTGAIGGAAPPFILNLRGEHVLVAEQLLHLAVRARMPRLPTFDAAIEYHRHGKIELLDAFLDLGRDMADENRRQRWHRMRSDQLRHTRAPAVVHPKDNGFYLSHRQQ